MSVPSSIPSTEDKTYQHNEFINTGPQKTWGTTSRFIMYDKPVPSCIKLKLSPQPRIRHH